MRIWVLFFIFLPYLSFSQTLSPEVIVPTGDFFKTPNASLSWTLGETVTETFSTPTSQLTQGFQQSHYIISSVNEASNDAIAINFYPNPATDFVTLTLSKNSLRFSVLLYDLAGKLILQKHGFKEKAILDFSQITTGIYLLKVYDTDTNILKTIKIQKTN